LGWRAATARKPPTKGLQTSLVSPTFPVWEGYEEICIDPWALGGLGRPSLRAVCVGRRGPKPAGPDRRDREGNALPSGPGDTRLHGQVWNAAEFARALGSSEPTARAYLDILAGAFMVRVLPPWFENLKKRQLKAPKIYVRDSGLLHSLQDLESMLELAGHPKLGASWEGFVIEQVLACLDARSPTFWATHGGAELDLLVTVRGKRYGFECKYADAPGTTKSMRVALQDLGLTSLYVVYPGSERYQLDDRIEVLPAADIPVLAKQLNRP
jgi:Domain of unknown function (DUF4143)